MNGPGKYDKETADAMAATEADAVVMIVFDGRLGSGFEVHTRSAIVPPHMIAEVLRSVASQIEAQGGGVRRPVS